MRGGCNVLEINRIYNEDCIGEYGMPRLDDKSIDLILADLPYGITARNSWDKVIPYDLLWEQYLRVIKDKGAIVLFGSGRFSAELINSNPKHYRYSLVWKKTTSTGFLNANRMPLKIHEDILIFYKKQPIYNPQKTTGHEPVHSYTKHTSDGTNYGKTKLNITGGGSTERYPVSVIEFATDRQKENLHPTQKPLALMEYLIKTFTNPGDLVLDNCIGSGTTALAALNCGRNFIGFEKNMSIYLTAVKRIMQKTQT